MYLRFFLFLGFILLNGWCVLPAQLAVRKDSLNIALRKACERCDLPQVKNTLEEGAYVNNKPPGGWTPLQIAVSKGEEKIAKYLMKKGAGVQIRTLNGMTLLHICPDEKLSRYLLLEKKLPKEAKGVGNRSILHEVAQRGQIGTLRTLLKLGADPGFRTLTGETPLMAALKADRTDCARLLLAFGADPAQPQNDGLRPLHIVNDLKLLKKIAEKDTLFFEPGFAGISPFEYAFRHNRTEAAAFYLSKIPDINIYQPRKPWFYMAINQGNDRLAILLAEKKVDLHQPGDNGQTPLHVAVRAGNLNLIKLILAAKPAVNKADEFGLRPLHYARNIETAQLLINAGAEVKTQALTTPLHFAVRTGNVAYVKFLIKQGAEVAKTDEAGKTPLHYASNLAVARALVESGSPADTPSVSGKVTPLMTAADGDVAKFLIQKMASPNAADTDGATPLIHAVKREQVEIAFVLLNSGAKINAQDNEGKTALYYAAEKDHFGLVKMLLDKRAKPETENGVSPLMAVVSPRIGRLLTDKGASLHLTTDLKNSAWMRALQRNDTALARLYISLTKDFNFIDGSGRSLLHLCIETNANDVFMQLVRAGIKLDLSSEDGGRDGGESSISKRSFSFWDKFHRTENDLTFQKGDTPLLTALRNKKSWFAQNLIEAGADVNKPNRKGQTPLMVAAQNGLNDVARLLMRKGASVNAEAADGETPLFYCNDFDLAKLMIETGANVKAFTRSGKTPLHKAAFMGDVTYIRRLLAKQADINAQEVRFGTPLHVALRYKHPDAAAALISAGADVHLTNVKDETPLHLAVQIPDLAVCEQLIKKGASVNVLNADNDTPLTLAFEASAEHPDFFKTVKLLADKGADVSAPKSQIAPLMLAVSKYRIEYDSLCVDLTDYLLRRGADPRGDNINTGENALNMAILVLDQVLDTASVNPKGILTIVKMLLQKEVPVNVSGRKGTPLLHAITVYGNKYRTDRVSFDIILELIKNGASVHLTDKSGNNALHKAAYYGDPLLTELILARKPKLNTRNKDGETALTVARKQNHPAVVKLLIKAGAE